MPSPSRGPLLFCLLALAAACGEGGRPAADGSDTARSGGGGPERGGTAVTAELADMEKPMPVVYQSDFDGDLIDILYMGLTRGQWRDGRLAYLTSNESPMAMAWHWEYVGPDSASIRYRMKSGLKWSDGEPITAHDVVWTYRMFAAPEAASPRQEDVATVDSVAAEDDSTVVFHFERRSPEMLFVTSIPIAPRHAYEAAGARGLRTHPALSDPTKMVVSGPFRIGEWRPGTQITLVPNERFSVRPHLDRLVVRIIPETTTRLVELQNGTVDFVRNIPFDQVEPLKSRAPNLRFQSIEKRFWEYVAYNPRRGPPFDDARTRRALGMAVDVPGIIRALGMEEFTEPAAGPYPPIFRDLYDPRRMRPLRHDPDSARALLEAAGWRDTDGDGVREKGGKRLSFTLLTNSGNARRADVSTILQQQWKAVGADVRLRQMEFNTVQERQFESHDFDALLGSWAVPLSPDFSPMWAPESPYNFVAFRDTGAMALIDRARAEPTPERANPLWRAAAERIVAAQPYTWLYYYDIVVGINDRLKDTRIDTFGGYQNVWEWWIPRDRQGRRGTAGDTSAAAGDTTEGGAR